MSTYLRTAQTIPRSPAYIVLRFMILLVHAYSANNDDDHDIDNTKRQINAQLTKILTTLLVGCYTLYKQHK